VYAREVGFCIVRVFVNNLLICSENDRADEIGKTQLPDDFRMTNIEELIEIVGWNINKISNGTTIDQSSFIRRLTQQYDSKIMKTLKTKIVR
jgi:hypothetical protein